MRAIPVFLLAILQLLVAAQPGSADDAAVARKVTELLRARKYEEAAKVFDQGLKEYPHSRRIHNYAVTMYSILNRDGKTMKGASYLAAHVNFLLSPQGFRPNTGASIANSATHYASVLDRAGKKKQVTLQLDAWIAKAKQLTHPEAASVAVVLYGRKAVRLAEGGRRTEAQELVSQQLSLARTAFRKRPRDVIVVLTLADLLQVRVEVETVLRSKTVAAATAEFVHFVTEQARIHPDNVRLLSAYFTAKTRQVSRVVRSEPAKAEKILEEIERFFAAEDADAPGLAVFKRSVQRTLATYRRTIASSKRLLSLIGKPAFAFGNADWVNGKPLDREALRGKVVLIDFWAVWCVPCIQTFPALRALREKYKDQGLVIVGATRYYQDRKFEDGKLKRAATPLTVTEEQEMLRTFARHYKLKYRFAVFPPGDAFHKSYLVKGIPQAVVIDRQGVIRLIRVGNGKANASDVESMIQKCLSEKADD